MPVDKRTFDGAAVSRIEAEVPPDVPAIRDRLHAADIDTFEADVRFAMRYLIERGVKGGCEIEGEATPGVGVTWVFDNPTLTPAEVKVVPNVLSFDIETDTKGERLLAISMYAVANGTPSIDEVLIVDSSDRAMPQHATRCVDEYTALAEFTDRIRKLDPDVLTGWNLIDFDLTVLQRIAARVRHPFDIGRDSTRDTPAQGGRLFRQRSGDDPGPGRAGWHRPAARRFRAHGRLFARRRGARSTG